MSAIDDAEQEGERAGRGIVPAPPSLIADIKKLWKHAVKLGVLLALICHFVPPQYRGACNAIANCLGN